MNPINLTVTPQWKTEQLPSSTRTGINDPSRVFPEKRLFLGNFFVASYKLELISCHPPKIAYSATTGKINGWGETEYHYFDSEDEAIAFCLEEMSRIIKLLEARKDR